MAVGLVDEQARTVAQLDTVVLDPYHPSTLTCARMVHLPTSKDYLGPGYVSTLQLNTPAVFSPQLETGRYRIPHCEYVSRVRDWAE